MIRSIEKKNGWLVPGLAHSRMTGRRKLLPKGYGVSEVPLHVTVFKPRRETRATISLFGLQEDHKTLVMGERTGAVRSIIRCDVDNRVFVYIVSFYALVADSTGHVSYSGMYGAQYFDKDGDGIFESYEPGPTFFIVTTQPNKRLERTRQLATSIRSCVGEPLKRHVRLLE
ncbi:MAG: hypothetical protein DMF69_12865 [Acidobacteria bacterium]|nr:MAG: hypothetical protein DMF69_12865 [Acidobacteriota bacterium]